MVSLPNPGQGSSNSGLDSANKAADGDVAANLQRAWFQACSEREARLLLDQLFAEYLRPWCAQATRRTLRIYSSRGSDQAPDVEADVMLQITSRLMALRAAGEPPIDDLRAYVGAAVYNACFMRLRARCPERVRLQNRIRYLLRHDMRFALWQGSDGELVAGLAAMRGSSGHGTPAAVAFAPRDTADLIAKVLGETGEPVLFSELVGCAAEALNLAEALPVAAPEGPAGKDVPVLTSLMEQEHLRGVWAEMESLPANQRSAVLLNLRDAGGNGVIELIPALGIASFDALAQAIGITGEELAELWNELPLEDARIAARLGLTRQQVVNLRKSARERLGRRLGRRANMQMVSASTGALSVLEKAERAIRGLFGKDGAEPR